MPKEVRDLIVDFLTKSCSVGRSTVAAAGNVRPRLLSIPFGFQGLTPVGLCQTRLESVVDRHISLKPSFPGVGYCSAGGNWILANA